MKKGKRWGIGGGGDDDDDDGIQGGSLRQGLSRV